MLLKLNIPVTTDIANIFFFFENVALFEAYTRFKHISSYIYFHEQDIYLDNLRTQDIKLVLKFLVSSLPSISSWTFFSMWNSLLQIFVKFLEK